MDPQSNHAAKPNPLLARLNEEDESHSSTRVDFLHPGTVVHPTTAAPAAPEATEAPPAPEPAPVPEPPVTPPAPTEQPKAPKSPRNGRPIMVAVVVLLVLALLGGGAAYYWFQIRPNQDTEQAAPTSPTPVQVTAVAPTNLAVKTASGQTVTSGGTTKVPLDLTFSMTTSANTGTVEPQVEVQPVGTAFTGTANYKGSAITANGSDIEAKVSATDLKDGQYHWQARFVVGETAGDWTAANATGAADFIIDGTAPGAASVTSVGSKTIRSGATTVSTTDNRPTVSGTAEVGSTVSITILPDGQTGSATTDASGNWTIALSQDLANGDHSVAIATTDSSGNKVDSSFTISVNNATVAPATTEVAPTGENALALTLLGAALIMGALGGLILVGSHGSSKL